MGKKHASQYVNFGWLQLFECTSHISILWNGENFTGIFTIYKNDVISGIDKFTFINNGCR